MTKNHEEINKSQFNYRTIHVYGFSLFSVSCEIFSLLDFVEFNLTMKNSNFLNSNFYTVNFPAGTSTLLHIFWMDHNSFSIYYYNYFVHVN